jgi:hypothetical protein
MNSSRGTGGISDSQMANEFARLQMSASKSQKSYNDPPKLQQTKEEARPKKLGRSAESIDVHGLKATGNRIPLYEHFSRSILECYSGFVAGNITIQGTGRAASATLTFPLQPAEGNTVSGLLSWLLQEARNVPPKSSAQIPFTPNANTNENLHALIAISQCLLCLELKGPFGSCHDGLRNRLIGLF